MGDDGIRNFIEWALSNGYKEHLTIDCIDSAKGYSPENCQWISHSENSGRVKRIKDKKGKHYIFIAVLHRGDDGVSVSFPDLPGCLPCGDTMDEAMKNAKEALALHLYGMEQDGENIPVPTTLDNIKLEHNEAAAAIEVFMPPWRERIVNQFVKKTLSLPGWLATAADESDVNCSKLFQNALIEYLEIEPPQDYKHRKRKKKPRHPTKTDAGAAHSS